MRPIRQAIMRRKRTLAVVAVLTVAATALSTIPFWCSRDEFAEFVDQDLRKLNDDPRPFPVNILARHFPDQFPRPRTRLNRTLERVLPEKENPFTNSKVKAWGGF